jgi:hypothetical protein
LQSKHVAGTESIGEAPVLIRTIEVIVRIATAGIVSDPRSVSVNMRRIWMPRCVAKVANAVAMKTLTTHWRGTVTWNESTTDAAMHATTVMHAATTMFAASVLCIDGNSTRQRKRKKSDCCFHINPGRLGVARRIPASQFVLLRGDVSSDVPEKDFEMPRNLGDRRQQVSTRDRVCSPASFSATSHDLGS